MRNLPTREHIRSTPVLDPRDTDFDTANDKDFLSPLVRLSPPAWVELEVPDWAWQDFMAERYEEEQASWR